jgi:hypothetical protein
MMDEINNEDTAEISLEDIAEFKQSIPVARSTMYELEEKWQEAFRGISFVRRLALAFLSTNGQDIIKLHTICDQDLANFIDSSGPKARQALQELIQLIEAAETRINLAGAIHEHEGEGHEQEN